MDTSTMKYPFGKCACCGKEFNAELRNEYKITYCPWCGDIIHDYIHDTNPPSGLLKKPDPEHYIYCEDCGRRIYEYTEETEYKGGRWIDETAGQCSGPCERELCGNCGDWDINGECEFCRNSPCGSCQNHNALDVCRKCEHLSDRKKWADWEDENPFNGREDERNCHCNNCEAKFREGEIIIKGDQEYCPACGRSGFIADDSEEEDEPDDDCLHCANNCGDEKVCEGCEYNPEK
jgi:hypothetical protein